MNIAPILLIPISNIDIGDRVRENLTDIPELAESIRRQGLLHPIIVTEKLELVAGHRRLAAAVHLNWPEIPCRIFEHLSTRDRKIIELEENTKRSQLPWQDECGAVLQLHDLLSEGAETWTLEDTAEYLGYSIASVSNRVAVARSLRADPKALANARSADSARTILYRDLHRKMDTEIRQMEDVEKEESSIHVEQQDFLGVTYTGPKFNLLHCDFPYGVDLHKSGYPLGYGKRYKDTSEIYWALVQKLCTDLERLLYSSSHIVFWLSMEKYTETLAYFKENSNIQFLNHPLVWHKTDNAGLIPDPRYTPRRTYEVALLGRLGTRELVQVAANSYGSPTDSSGISVKPEPMLAHFFKMLVNETTELLDPTCGSGTALVVASRLGATRAVGWDTDPVQVEAARNRVHRFTTLRNLEGKL